jgi:hypothetical protein
VTGHTPDWYEQQAEEHLDAADRHAAEGAFAEAALRLSASIANSQLGLIKTMREIQQNVTDVSLRPTEQACYSCDGTLTNHEADCPEVARPE